MSIQEVAISEGFSNNTTDKAEKAHMIGVDATVLVRLKGASIFGGRKKSIIGIKHFLGEDSKEFA